LQKIKIILSPSTETAKQAEDGTLKEKIEAISVLNYFR